MEILVGDNLRCDLEDEAACRRAYGADMARKIALRITALRAAESLGDFWPPKSGLTPKTISEICNGKAPITPSTALAFEKVFQRPAHFWLNLQRFFDEAEARHHELSKASYWSGWVKHFPLKEMKRLKFSLPEGH